jgi:hypothetical protein
VEVSEDIPTSAIPALRRGDPPTRPGHPDRRALVVRGDRLNHERRALDSPPIPGNDRRRVMRGIVFNAPKDVSVETVPDPTILEPGDAVVRVTKAGICGSDMHIYNHGDAFGFSPG